MDNRAIRNIGIPIVKRFEAVLSPGWIESLCPNGIKDVPEIEAFYLGYIPGKIKEIGSDIYVSSTTLIHKTLELAKGKTEKRLQATVNVRSWKLGELGSTEFVFDPGRSAQENADAYLAAVKSALAKLKRN